MSRFFNESYFRKNITKSTSELIGLWNYLIQHKSSHDGNEFVHSINDLSITKSIFKTFSDLSEFCKKDKFYVCIRGEDGISLKSFNNIVDKNCPINIEEVVSFYSNKPILLEEKEDCFEYGSLQNIKECSIFNYDGEYSTKQDQSKGGRPVFDQVITEIPIHKNWSECELYAFKVDNTLVITFKTGKFNYSRPLELYSNGCIMKITDPDVYEFNSISDIKPFYKLLEELYGRID